LFQGGDRGGTCTDSREEIEVEHTLAPVQGGDRGGTHTCSREEIEVEHTLAPRRRKRLNMYWLH